MAYTDRCLQGRERYNAFMAIVLHSLAADKDTKKYPPNILQTLKHCLLYQEKVSSCGSCNLWVY